MAQDFTSGELANGDYMVRPLNADSFCQHEGTKFLSNRPRAVEMAAPSGLTNTSTQMMDCNYPWSLRGVPL